MWYDELFSQLRTHDDNTVWHFHLLSTTYIAFHKTYKKPDVISPLPGKTSYGKNSFGLEFRYLL